MDNEKCRHLIQLYGSKEFLWNSKIKDYHSKSLRQDAWKDISAVLRLPIPDLKKKMTTLLASYRKEKFRIAKSFINGSGGDDVYSSKWFAFDDFNFMKDKDLPNETSDTMTEDISLNQNEITNDEEPITQSAMEKQAKEPKRKSNVSYTPRKKNIKRKTNTDEESPMLKKTFQILSEPSSPSTDLYFTYGQHIANELRKYDQRTLVYVKQAINNIIFEADLGKYTHYGYYTKNYKQTRHKISYNSVPFPQFSMASHTPSIQSPQRPILSPPSLPQPSSETSNDESFESSTD